MAKIFYGTAGNDLLSYTASGAMIYAYGGNDNITSYGDSVTIDAGFGNDTIQNVGGSKVSVYGGAGNDYIYINRQNDSIGKNVTINGGAGNDSILSTSGKGNVFEYDLWDGNDVILGFNSKNDTLQVNSSSYSPMVIGDDIIVFVGMGSITLKDSANFPVKIRNSSGKLTTYNNKLQSTTANIMSGSIFDDEFVNTNKNAVIMCWSGNDTVANFADEVFIGGGGPGEYGNNFIVNIGNKVSIEAGEGNDYVAGIGDNSMVIGYKGNDTIIFQGKANTISGGEGDDLISLNSANGGNLIEYSNGYGNDTLYGYKTGDTLHLYSGYISKVSVSGSDIIATIGDYTFTGIGFKGKILNMSHWHDGDYSVKVDSEDSMTFFVNDKTVGNGELTPVAKVCDASARTKAIKITGNGKANSIIGGSGKDTLWGGAGNDTLTGGKGNDVFIYSAGKDVITDYSKGDTISIGADISKATVSGDDVVFTIGKGSLKIKEGRSKTLSLIDSTGEGFSTIIGGATKLTVTDKTKSPVTVDAEIKTINASKRTTAVKITGNSLANTITGGAGNDSLYGGKGNDSISGGKGKDKLFGQAGNDILRGGAGNDTITGGKGNDSLWGDAGKDVFVYADGDGKDIIFGFENNDMLKITGDFSASYSKSKGEIYFKGGDTSKAITLKDFTATSFNVNGDTYKISGSTLVEK